MSLNLTGIEWCSHSWNPLYGCKHTTRECACADHCYASVVSSQRLNLDFTKTMFHVKRLADVTPKQKPRVIFVGSMTDMMGKWWLDKTIQAVIDRCQACPQHIFMWLTKNPERYLRFDWPSNVVLGASITSQEESWREVYMGELRRMGFRTMISYEPMMGWWTPSIPYYWIVAGAMTKNGALHPDYPVPGPLNPDYYGTLLVKSPLSTSPAHKQFPPEIKVIMDTWKAA